ncbi:MAG: tyrosine-type recombinase/integrase [Desulfobulbaceae bacterium]|jgi:integrase|nr:tyrosine-type recombinase/integrase [Desulfobulbaceae bacterium]
MKVYPIKDELKIKTLKKLLSNEPRNLLLFTLGLNSGLRMGDILKLKVQDVLNKGVGDKVYLVEGKTKKQNYFIINTEVLRVIELYLDTLPTLNPESFLFPSRKGSTPLLVESVNHMIKKWCKEIGIKENVGCHTLRKTFGYFQHKKFGVSVPELMVRFNHSSQDTTLRYIGIDSKVVNLMLMNEI